MHQHLCYWTTSVDLATMEECTEGRCCSEYIEHASNDKNGEMSCSSELAEKKTGPHAKTSQGEKPVQPEKSKERPKLTDPKRLNFLDMDLTDMNPIGGDLDGDFEGIPLNLDNPEDPDDEETHDLYDMALGDNAYEIDGFSRDWGI